RPETHALPLHDALPISGAPIERVLANMVRGFSLQVAPTPSGAHAQPQSYFVTDLFEKIIFPDRDIATRSGSRIKRHLRTQALVRAEEHTSELQSRENLL